MDKEKYLTLRWNNILALSLGLVALVFFVAVLATAFLPDRTAFIVMVIFGVVY